MVLPCCYCQCCSILNILYPLAVSGIKCSVQIKILILNEPFPKNAMYFSHTLSFHQVNSGIPYETWWFHPGTKWYNSRPVVQPSTCLWHLAWQAADGRVCIQLWCQQKKHASKHKAIIMYNHSWNTLKAYSVLVRGSTIGKSRDWLEYSCNCL